MPKHRSSLLVIAFAVAPLLAGCPGDDGGDTMGDTGSGSATMGSSASATAATDSASASASASNTNATSDSGVPPACIEVGEDGPGVAVCPDDVGCELECDLDFQTCCADGMTEWTCTCPMRAGGGTAGTAGDGTAGGGGSTAGSSSTGGLPCIWTSPSCGG